MLHLLREFVFGGRLQAVPKGNELIQGVTTDNLGRNETHVAHITQNSHSCPSEKSCR